MRCRRRTNDDAVALRARSAMALGVVALVTACERPPVVGTDLDGDPPPTGVDVVDITTFVQDRPAIGGKWYDYSVDGHVLTPKPEAWVLRAADGAYASFRIASVYDEDTGDSGRFTLERATYDAGAWGASSTFTVDGNVKDGAPLCVDVRTPAQLDCQAPGWHLRLVQQSRLSVLAGFAVAEPAVFLADDVVVARLAVAADRPLVPALPDPAAIPDLDEAPPADPTTTDWDFVAFARDLPVNGRALGALDLVDGQTFKMVTTTFELATVTITRGADATARVDVVRRPIAREDGSLGEAVQASVDVDLGDPLPVFLKLDAADLYTPADALAGASWPTRAPFAKAYDLVVVGEPDASAPSVLLSPATAATRVFDASLSPAEP